MNICMVCKKSVSSHLPQLVPIPLIGIIESTNGWVSHSDCLFRLILHPTNNFLEGLASVNKLDIHFECRDVRISCSLCQQMIAEVLGLPLGVFKVLKAYILRLEKGQAYQHQFE